MIEGHGRRNKSFPYLRDLTALDLYREIASSAPFNGDRFSVSIRRVAERTAVARLIADGVCELADCQAFYANEVQLRRRI